MAYFGMKSVCHPTLPPITYKTPDRAVVGHSIYKKSAFVAKET